MLKLRKNKIVIPVILFTTLISISSVGLSAWLIRVDESTKLFEANLVIEGVVTKIATLEVTNNTQKIVFNGASGGSGIVKGDNVGDQPQQNVDVSYTIITHKDNLDTLVKNGLTLSIKVTKDGSEKDWNNYVQPAEDKLFGRTKDETYTLVELDKNHINLDKSSFKVYKNNEDFMTTKLTSNSGDFLKINYGTYFGNKKPEDNKKPEKNKTPDVFYSEYIKQYQDAYYSTINNSSSTEEQKQKARDNYFNSISQTNNELNNIKKILNGSTITITSKVSVD